MEPRSEDNVCSLYSNEDFVNHVTINLFKKKNNLKVTRVSTSKREIMRNNLHNGFAIKGKQNSLSFMNNNDSSQIVPRSSPCDSSRKSSHDSRTLISNSDTSTESSSHSDTPLANFTHQFNQPFKIKNCTTVNLTVPNPATVNMQAKQSVNPTKTSPLPPFSTKNPPTPNTDRGPNPASDDLTPLSWLHSLDMGGVVPHLAAPPTPPASPVSSQNSGISDGSYKESPPSPQKIDYSVDGSAKPPYSYAALICMAMKENDNKMTLSAIYKWIKEHFVFYKTADQSWQNSIRHNLSLNKCFLKVARSKDEPGKGGFWKLDPEYADSLIDGAFKKRRPSRGTAPPTTKTKQKKPLYTHQIQQQVKKQRQKQQEEYLRQKEQEEAVRNLLQPVQEPVQAAYMPPPTDKPPSISTMYMDQQEPMERTLLVDESGNPLKEDFVWSSILRDETEHDDSWQFRTQEVITDITQSGDPSTYQLTASPTPSMTSMSSSTSSLMTNFNSHHPPDITPHYINQPMSQQNLQTLPSFELSPESLGMEEDLFGSPEYSDTPTDDRDSFITSFDLSVGLDLAVSTTTPWENDKAACNTYTHVTEDNECERTLEITASENGMLMNIEGSQDLVELRDLEGNLTHLTTLEPATPVVVQHVNTQTWNQEQTWEEARTLSLLEANLDFDKLIDLDVI